MTRRASDEAAAVSRAPVAGLVFDEPILGQPLEHPGHGRGADLQRRGDLVGGDDAVGPAEGVDRLQVVLNGRAQGAVMQRAREVGPSGPGSIAAGGSVANGGGARRRGRAHASPEDQPIDRPQSGLGRHPPERAVQQPAALLHGLLAPRRTPSAAD